MLFRSVSMIAVAALGILSAVIFQGSDSFMRLTSEMLKSVDFIAIGIFAVILALLIKFKLNPILVMLASGIAGFFLYKFI